AALVDGTIYKGCNVENASYGGTICAERSAIVSGVAAGARSIELVAITTDNRNRPSLADRSPCGLCRQFIAEFAHPAIPILLDRGDHENGRLIADVLPFGDLFPLAFRLEAEE
ncbi:MAG: cytidine deaminase, partial [Verrucomicrobiota bacterium]